MDCGTADMGNVISLGYLVSFLVGLGAVWVVVPSAVVYLVLHRVRRGSWAIPYSIVDVVTWVAIGYVWFFTYTWLGSEKDWGNLLDELIGLGGLFGLLLCVRLPFVWRHPEWKLKFAFATSAAILLVAVLVAWLIPDLGGC